MAKESGLGDQLFIGGYDIGANVSQINNISTPRATLPGTAITQSAEARIFGLRDASAEFTAYFDPAVGASHEKLRTLPLTDTQLMYLHGTTLGNEAFSMVGKQLNYDGTRADDGSFMFGVSCQSNGFGGDWGNQLTAGKRSDTVATNGTGVNYATAANPTSAAFGFEAYLQVFSFTGTSVTIQLQDSADNVSFANLTDGAFTVVSAAPTFERIQSSSATATVRQYVRVITTGTFSQCSFAVTFTRNENLRVI
jgi:hypothetical protein